ncbi:hypothetical protein Mapa_002375 [Marchantia paleacea]|nr:hypothetical protein Mapa_002375 [Marchantia paleacea]
MAERAEECCQCRVGNWYANVRYQEKRLKEPVQTVGPEQESVFARSEGEVQLHGRGLLPEVESYHNQLEAQVDPIREPNKSVQRSLNEEAFGQFA